MDWIYFCVCCLYRGFSPNSYKDYKLEPTLELSQMWRLANVWDRSVAKPFPKDLTNHQRVHTRERNWMTTNMQPQSASSPSSSTWQRLTSSIFSKSCSTKWKYNIWWSTTAASAPCYFLRIQNWLLKSKKIASKIVHHWKTTPERRPRD